MKKRYEQEMGVHEAFLEAVPTCFVITILLTSAISKFYEIRKILKAFQSR